MALSRQGIATTFLQAEERKLTYLAKALINQDGFLDDAWMQSQCDQLGYRILAAAYDILLKMPAAVVQAIIRGDLPEVAQHPDVRALQNPRYVAAPTTILTNVATIHPSIYAIYLIDKTTNKPPTIADLQKIAAVAGLTSTNPATRNLIRELRDRIRGCNPQDTLVGGLVDVGFSADGTKRILQHYNGFNTNEVMKEFRTAVESMASAASLCVD